MAYIVGAPASRWGHRLPAGRDIGLTLVMLLTADETGGSADTVRASPLAQDMLHVGR